MSRKRVTHNSPEPVGPSSMMFDLSSTNSCLSDSSTSLRKDLLEVLVLDLELHSSFSNEDGPRGLCNEGTPADDSTKQWRIKG